MDQKSLLRSSTSITADTPSVIRPKLGVVKNLQCICGDFRFQFRRTTPKKQKILRRQIIALGEVTTSTWPKTLDGCHCNPKELQLPG